jgi:hypothetical protein
VELIISSTGSVRSRTLSQIKITTSCVDSSSNFIGWPLLPALQFSFPSLPSSISVRRSRFATAEFLAPAFGSWQRWNCSCEEEEECQTLEEKKNTKTKDFTKKKKNSLPQKPRSLIGAFSCFRAWRQCQLLHSTWLRQKLPPNLSH